MGMQPSDQAHDCHVTTLALSEYGDIVVFCKQGSSRTLCRYSVNGKLLAKDGNLKQDVEDVIICDEFVITGGANGRLGIRVLYRSVKTRAFLTPPYEPGLRQRHVVATNTRVRIHIPKLGRLL